MINNPIQAIPVKCEKRSWFQRNFIHNICYKVTKGEYVYFMFMGIWCRRYIKEGYIFDGASVPWLVWMFVFPPDGLQRRGTTLHDDIYENKGLISIEVLVDSEKGLTWEKRNIQMSRETCDQIFHDHIVEDGIGPNRAARAHGFLKVFGRTHWFSTKPDAWL
jgi:hypothetical protein